MKKLHQALFYALIIFLPIQLGRHFWPEWTYVLGLKIDYLAPTFYLTDILVGAILALWFWESRRKLTIDNVQFAIRKYWWIAAIFLYLFIISFFAQNPGAALYKFIKIVEFFFLAFYIVKNNYTLHATRYALPIPIIYSSLIAITQFIKQASLNGLFWWLGERTFNAFTPGVAKAIISGRLVMRPYATFSHPNALAGFLLVSLILMGISNRGSRIRKTLRKGAAGLGVIAIATSFSRSAWFVGLLAGAGIAGYSLWRRKKKTLNLSFLVLFMVFIGIFFYFTPQLSTKEAFSLRLESTRASLAMIKKQPLVGVGLNNFIVQLPSFWQTPELVRFLQPVHNIYLLVVAETGLIGFAAFTWLLILTFKKLLLNYNKLLITALSVILALGLFDHYWLTLQQTQLLFAIILGLSWADKTAR